MHNRSVLLFADPSFIGGIASAFDVEGTFLEANVSSSPEQADWLALRSDWQNIGQDAREALRLVVEEFERSRDE